MVLRLVLGCSPRGGRRRRGAARRQRGALRRRRLAPLGGRRLVEAWACTAPLPRLQRDGAGGRLGGDQRGVDRGRRRRQGAVDCGRDAISRRLGRGAVRLAVRSVRVAPRSRERRRRPSDLR